MGGGFSGKTNKQWFRDYPKRTLHQSNIPFWCFKSSYWESSSYLIVNWQRGMFIRTFPQEAYTRVMIIIVTIYTALLICFRNAIKCLIMLYSLYYACNSCLFQRLTVDQVLAYWCLPIISGHFSQQLLCSRVRWTQDLRLTLWSQTLHSYQLVHAVSIWKWWPFSGL